MQIDLGKTIPSHFWRLCFKSKLHFIHLSWYPPSLTCIGPKMGHLMVAVGFCVPLLLSCQVDVLVSRVDLGTGPG